MDKGTACTRTIKFRGDSVRVTQYANKGIGFESEVEMANDYYFRNNIARIRKLPTPVKILRIVANKVHGFLEKKSTLDFYGAWYGRPISFDTKESEDIRGLPLKYIQEHQIEYIRDSAIFGEISFLLCYVKPLNKRYLIDRHTVILRWDMWQENKGRRGFNLISVEEMQEVLTWRGCVLDYLSKLDFYELAKESEFEGQMWD